MKKLYAHDWDRSANCFRKGLWLLRSFSVAFGVLFCCSAKGDVWLDVSTGYTWNYSDNDDGTATLASPYDSARHQFICGVSPRPSGVLAVPALINGLAVKAISNGYFRRCYEMSSVVIPATVSSVDSSAFQECVNLRTFSVDGNNAVYSTVDGLLCDKTRETLILCPNAQTAVRIPDSITDIGERAFQSCGWLKSVVVPKTVSSLGAYAFALLDMLEIEFEGIPPAGIEAAGIGDANDVASHTVKVFYNMQYEEEWSRMIKICKFRNAIPFVLGSEKPNQKDETESVNVLTTNVCVHYVLNSIQPQFAIPASLDVGFVNIVAEVKGGCVAVPATWMVSYPNFVSKFGSDFTKALAMKTGKRDGAGNEMLVWQDYVAGTDPTDENDVFRASIAIVDGKVIISYTPELDAERKAMRKYTIWGKTSLMDANWTEVPEGREAEYNFFKVSVEMR